jgi:hypothetical protein
MGPEGIAGSCPAPSSHLDAELPYFSGKSIRTHPNLASLQAVSRAGSAYGGPSSATSMLAAETPFTQGDGLFQHASSPLATPRSPLFDMNATAMAGSNGMLDVQGTSNMPAKVGAVAWCGGVAASGCAPLSMWGPLVLHPVLALDKEQETAAEVQRDVAEAVGFAGYLLLQGA